ncbi:hypothetical protein CHU98_g1581 [Xylaria longipes]|nr:hypothetical protein CHU98_g1581 [Xylaria longipes]
MLGEHTFSACWLRPRNKSFAINRTFDPFHGTIRSQEVAKYIGNSTEGSTDPITTSIIQSAITCILTRSIREKHNLPVRDLGRRMLPTSGPSLSAWCAFDKGQAWNPQHIITQPQEARAPLDNANLRYRHYVDRGAVDVQLGLSWGWRGTAVHRGNEVSIQYAGQAAAYYSLGPLLFLKTGARWNLELPLKRSRPSELPSQLCQLSYLPTLPTPGASPSTYTSKVGQDVQHGFGHSWDVSDFPLQQQSKLTYRFAGRMTPALWLSLTRISHSLPHTPSSISSSSTTFTPGLLQPSHSSPRGSRMNATGHARKRKQEEEEEELVALPSDESEEEDEYVSDEEDDDDDEDAEEDEEEYDDEGEPEVKNGVKPEAPPKKKQKTTTASNDAVPIVNDGKGEEEEEDFDEEEAEAALGEEYDEDEGVEEEEWDDADEPISKAKVGVGAPAGGKNSSTTVTAGGDDEDD